MFLAPPGAGKEAWAFGRGRGDGLLVPSRSGRGAVGSVHSWSWREDVGLAPPGATEEVCS